ncbi:outer membrane protein [Legionella sp. CNM-4043-24]|uniref:outer membrane protein n=1 Tax=Legionella sp. CNM-4043-24 TaxID=3421646 RepID=UPI00403A9A2A
MNIYSKLGLTGLMLASGIASAYQPAQGWYAGLMGGFSYAPSTSFSISNPFVAFFPEFASIPAKLSYNVGGNAGAQLGYRCDKFRVEGELNYNFNSYDRLRIGYFTIGSSHNVQGLNLSGHSNMYAGFINGFFDIYDEENMDTTWVPYVGLGIGYARVQNSIDFFIHNYQLNFLTAKASSNEPIGQAILGLNYFLSDNTSLGWDFRYMSTRKLDYLNSRFEVVTGNLVFNYSFDN